MNKSIYRRKTEAFHLPTKWLFFYLFIRFPLMILASLVVIIRDFLPLVPYLSSGRVPGLLTFAGILEIGNLALMLVTFIKLLKLSPSSFKWNLAYLWYGAGCQLFSCFIMYGFSTYFMGSLAGAFGWTISNLVYFNNRSELFEMEVPAEPSEYAPDYSYTQQPYSANDYAPYSPAAEPYSAPVPAPESPAPSAKFCGKCGSPIVPGAKFCNRCGNLLATDSQEAFHEL